MAVSKLEDAGSDASTARFDLCSYRVATTVGRAAWMSLR